MTSTPVVKSKVCNCAHKACVNWHLLTACGSETTSTVQAVRHICRYCSSTATLSDCRVAFVLWHFKKKNESTDNKITASWQLELLKRHSRAAVVGFTQYEPSHIYGLDGGPFVLSTGDLENRYVLTIQWYTDLKRRVFGGVALQDLLSRALLLVWYCL